MTSVGKLFCNEFHLIDMVPNTISLFHASAIVFVQRQLYLCVELYTRPSYLVLPSFLWRYHVLRRAKLCCLSCGVTWLLLPRFCPHPTFPLMLSFMWCGMDALAKALSSAHFSLAQLVCTRCGRVKETSFLNVSSVTWTRCFG